MSEGSGVRFECSSGECSYETVFFPEDPADESKWHCGYGLPEASCPECGNDSTGLGMTSTPHGLIPVEGGVEA